MSVLADRVVGVVQEALRGGDRRVPLKRLPDGTFAPRGTGQVLKAGDTATWTDSDGNARSGKVLGEVKTTKGSAPQFRIETESPALGKGKHVQHLPIKQPQTLGDLKPGENQAGAPGTAHGEAIRAGAQRVMRASPEQKRRMRARLDAAARREARRQGLTEAADPTALVEAAGPKIKLGNKPGKTNWVEKAGGLPSYVRRIAEHVKGKNPDWPDGRAIAVAVNSVQRMCASGDTNLPGAQNVNAKSRAEACAAFASWKAKAAKSKVSERALMAALADAHLLSEAEHREVIAFVKDGALQESLLEAAAPEGQRSGDLPRVKCPKCSHTGKPTSEGKCPNCGHDVKALANVVSRLRSKS